MTTQQDLKVTACHLITRFQLLKEIYLKSLRLVIFQCGKCIFKCYFYHSNSLICKRLSSPPSFLSWVGNHDLHWLLKIKTSLYVSKAIFFLLQLRFRCKTILLQLRHTRSIIIRHTFNYNFSSAFITQTCYQFIIGFAFFFCETCSSFSCVKHRFATS